MTKTKFCKTCGKIMWDVQPTKRYCDSCIRKRNIKSAQASYQRRRDAGVLKKGNHYKRAHDLETFRRYIAEIPRKLQENYIYKVGVVYGNVLENPKAIKFYFEKVRDNHETD